MLLAATLQPPDTPQVRSCANNSAAHLRPGTTYYSRDHTNGITSVINGSQMVHKIEPPHNDLICRQQITGTRGSNLESKHLIHIQ